MIKNPKLGGVLAALGAVVIWAGNTVVARGLSQEMPPVQLNFWRWSMALVLILPMAWPKLRSDWPEIRKRWPYLCAMAFFGVGCVNTLIYKAGQTTESINISLLLITSPVMIIILARVFFGEPITHRRLGGLGVVLLGVLILLARGDWRVLANMEFAAGDLWTLGASVCFALYTLFLRLRPASLSLAGYNCVVFALGLIISLPALAWEVGATAPPVWTHPVIAGVIYSGVGCSFLAYILWTRAITSIGPVLTGMVYYSMPLFTVVESNLILNERMAGFHILGGGLIIAGILLATVERRQSRKSKPSI